MLVVRQGQPISLVDAFENSITPYGNKSLLDNAVSKLDEHWAELTAMYGESSVKYKGIVTRNQLPQNLTALTSVKKNCVQDLVDCAVDAALTEAQ